MWVCAIGGIGVVVVVVVAAMVVVDLFDLGWVLRFVNVVGCYGFFILVVCVCLCVCVCFF